MSKLQLQGSASGTGVFTLAAPNSSVDKVLTLPDETGTVLSSVSDITTQTKAALNASGDAPIYACRAWVNFNGTGTVAIRASGNVSSITDKGVGHYTVNFSTAMPDINYCVTGMGKEGTSTTATPHASASPTPVGLGSYLTTSCSIGNANIDTNDWIDGDIICLTFFR